MHRCEIAIDVAGMILASINLGRIEAFFPPELGLLSDILYLFKLLLENWRETVCDQVFYKDILEPESIYTIYFYLIYILWCSCFV